jgi:hypothetical protein
VYLLSSPIQPLDRWSQFTTDVYRSTVIYIYCACLAEARVSPYSEIPSRHVKCLVRQSVHIISVHCIYNVCMFARDSISITYTGEYRQLARSYNTDQCSSLCIPSVYVFQHGIACIDQRLIAGQVNTTYILVESDLVIYVCSSIWSRVQHVNQDRTRDTCIFIHIEHRHMHICVIYVYIRIYMVNTGICIYSLLGYLSAFLTQNKRIKYIHVCLYGYKIQYVQQNNVNI